MPGAQQPDETRKQTAAFQGYRLVAWLGRTLPERSGRRLYTWLGRLGYRAFPSVRATVAANQARVLGRAPEDPVVQASTIEAFARYARYWFDTFHVLGWSDEEIGARHIVDGREHMEAALAKGRGSSSRCRTWGTGTCPADGSRPPGTGSSRSPNGWSPNASTSCSSRIDASWAWRSSDSPDRAVGQQLRRPPGAERGRGAGRRPRPDGARRGGGDVRCDPSRAGRAGAPVHLDRGAARRDLRLRDGRGLAVRHVRPHRGGALGEPPRGRHRAHTPDGGGVRARDLCLAFGLAPVPARLGVVRIALVCPYAWDDPGGVQVHVRELAEHLLGDAGTRSWSSRPVRAARRQILRPWARPSTCATTGRTRPSIRGRGRGARWSASCGGSAPTWSTCTSRSHRARRCGRPSWRRHPVVATFHSAAERSRLFDRGRAVAAARVAGASRSAWRCRSRRRRSPTSGSAAVSRSSRTAPTSPASPTPAADVGPGTKLLFVGRLDLRKGFPVALAAFARLARDRRETVRLIVVGDGPQRSRSDRCPDGSRAGRDAGRGPPRGACPPTTRRAMSSWPRRWAARASGWCWWRRWRPGCRSSRAPSRATATSSATAWTASSCRRKDPAALGTPVERILGDPALAERLRAAGRDRAATFDWSRVGAQLMERYERAVAQGSASLR